MLFNEPKLLKRRTVLPPVRARSGFSALQRAEIAETLNVNRDAGADRRFSALQRAEIAERHAERAAPIFDFLFQCSSTSRNC